MPRVSDERLRGYLEWTADGDFVRPEDIAADLLDARERIAELHKALVDVSRTTPYPDEAIEAVEQRRVLIAEVGTLRAALEEERRLRRYTEAEFEAEHRAYLSVRKLLEDKELPACPTCGSTMLMPFASIREAWCPECRCKFRDGKLVTINEK